MKTTKLCFLLICLSFCVIGCDRSQSDVDLLTIEELEAKSEELSLYSVVNYTLQDSLFFTREDGSIEGFAVNLVQSRRLQELSADINELTGEVTDFSLWEYGHSIQLESDSLQVLAGISIRQDNKYKGGVNFTYKDDTFKILKYRAKKENDKFSLISSSGSLCIFQKNIGITEFADDEGHKCILKEHKKISN
jgi:hypothetical protein